MKFGTVVAFFLTFLLSQLWGTLASPMIKAVAPQAFSTFAGSPGTSPFALMFDSVPAFWASADVMASWSNGFYQVHVNRKSTPIAVRSILNKGGEQIKLFDEWQFILPGHVFVYGNVRGGNPDDGYTGNLRAMDCDFNRNCWGEERMMTLFELTRESPVRTVTDLSLVNGYNMAMDVEFGKGSDCKPLNCTIPAQKILDLCPSERRSAMTRTSSNLM
ncbi:hypothetical protein M7I_7467 [Glarea lozoyensis 74030]|uniref:Uncharacterized protein n=1 Tax=Glarea lozoyensis (strain ATCC 74030 / MF5533) TaxID=1104152 RepID=H0EXD3_GLAL7|nr:hypothetical protein M7I_7467 [Glarea lozoyensis 74030]